MFSMTTSRSPRPKLRVTCRMRAVWAPHRSHRVTAFLDPSCDDDDLPGGTDLDDAAGRLAVEGLAFDDVRSTAEEWRSQIRSVCRPELGRTCPDRCVSTIAGRLSMPSRG